MNLFVFSISSVVGYLGLTKTKNVQELKSGNPSLETNEDKKGELYKYTIILSGESENSPR